jgi:glycosyltransferase involved in cell wall biosynthesis
MQIDVNHTPDYIFETSWEVCNKVGGIYTVLSTRANSLKKLHGDHVFYVGPDVWKEQDSPWFIEDTELFIDWRDFAFRNQNLEIRAGRWDVPGKPIVFLVKFDFLFPMQNDIYAQMWEDFRVDSIDAYGDYHESTMFAIASGMVMESFYHYHHLQASKVIAHFNEWQLGAGALYIKKNVPKIATIFTTHATSIGRSIAGNHLPLYDNLRYYNGDQMAHQLNMVSKHSIEKKAAQNVDCLTTVSGITAQECTQFFHRHPDVITVNGFEKGFIPKGKAFDAARKKARKTLFNVTEKTLGYSIQRDALFVGLSGRYEYKNKGIDVFIDAMNNLRNMTQMSRDVIAFIMVPGWIKGARKDIRTKISENILSETDCPFVTHELVEPQHDNVMNQIRHLGFCNSEKSRVKIIFVPSYLNGNDGIFNLSYYDLLIGFDVSVFPSYYEPWGYTPHESVAFSIPTITTSLAGFGVWAKKEGDTIDGLDDGIQVIHRNDENYHEVADEITSLIYDFSLKSAEQVKMFRQSAAALSDLADWEHFIVHYQEAYNKALEHSFVRLSKPYELMVND